MRFIHVFDEKTKEDLLKRGFKLVSDNKPYVFRNDTTKSICFDDKKMIYSNVVNF